MEVGLSGVDCMFDFMKIIGVGYDRGYSSMIYRREVWFSILALPHANLNIGIVMFLLQALCTRYETHWSFCFSVLLYKKRFRVNVHACIHVHEH